MADLNSTIQALASEFARDLLAALRGASLFDISEMGGGGRTKTASKRGRTPRPGWPRCKTCGKNAHPRGKGYCWEHALAAGVAKGKGGPGKAIASKAKAAKRKAAAKKK